MRSNHLLNSVFICILSISYGAFPIHKGQHLFDQCVTPNNLTGYCVKITECQYAIDLLLRRNLSQSVTKYLRQSQCGLVGTQVVVCCPNYTIPSNILLDAEACEPYVGNRIYGGSDAELNEFPWMALILYKKPFDQRGFHCVGSLINTRYVLTAAHCIDKMPKEWTIESVRLGEWNLETDPDCTENKTICAPSPLDIGIERITSHPKYNASSREQFYDIGIIRTITAVPFSDFIRPICLPVDSLWRNNLFTNLTVEVAGWGQTEHATYSPQKIKVLMPIWDITQCEEKFKTLDITIKGTYQLCAGGNNGQDTCRGDSGGPLVVTTQFQQRGYYFLAGIVSYGISNCGLAGWPGVYTRVGQHVEWIMDNMDAT